MEKKSNDFDYEKYETKRMIIFLIIAFGVCWFLQIGSVIPMYNSGNESQVSEAVEMINTLMFAPALGALLARFMTGEGFVRSGIQLNIPQHKFCYFFGWFGMTVLIFLGAVVYFLIFPNNFDPEMGAFAQRTLQSNPDMNVVDIVASFKTNLLINVFAAPVLNLINSFGVEWGFRGYFLPKLYRKFGTVPAMLISGFASGLWYAPLVSIGYYYGEDYAGFPVTGILAMCVFGTVTGCIYSFLSLRTGSIFPAVLANGTTSVMMTQAAVFAKDGGNLFVGPSATGIIGGIPLIITAVIFVVYAYKNPIKSSIEKKG